MPRRNICGENASSFALSSAESGAALPDEDKKLKKKEGKSMKKVLSLCVPLVLLLAVTGLSVFAGDTTPDVVFSLGDVSGAVGETVDIPLTVSVSNGATYNSVGLALDYGDISYDESVLEFVGFTDYADIEGKCYWTGVTDNAKKAIALPLDTAEAGTSYSGKICTVQFKILQAPESGEISVGMYSNVKQNSETRTSAVNAATITVEDDVQVLGDLNGDNEVTATDLTALACHVAKLNSLTDETALSNADVTKDGEITATDLTKLAQYVAKLIDTLD